MTCESTWHGRKREDSMTLLTPEEIDYEVAHISPEQVPDYENVHAELEALMGAESMTPFERRVTLWLEAAEKEIR